MRDVPAGFVSGGAHRTVRHRYWSDVLPGNRKPAGDRLVLASVVDHAMGYVLAQARQPPLTMATVNLSTTFLAPARASDWLDERLILRATGIFSKVPELPRNPGSENLGEWGNQQVSAARAERDFELAREFDQLRACYVA